MRLTYVFLATVFLSACSVLTEAGDIAKDGIPEDWNLFVGASLPIGRLVRGIQGE